MTLKDISCFRSCTFWMAKLLVSPTLKFACLLYFEGLFEKISRPSSLCCCNSACSTASKFLGRFSRQQTSTWKLTSSCNTIPSLLKNFSKEGNNFLLWINLSHHLLPTPTTTFPRFFSQKVPKGNASLQQQQMDSKTLFTILLSRLKPSKKLQACYKSYFQLANFWFVSVRKNGN